MIKFKSFDGGIRIAPNLLLSSDPLTGKVGEIYWNTTLGTLRICVDPAPVWQDLYIGSGSTENATLRWDSTANSWVENTELLIDGSLVYSAGGTTGSPLSLRAGTSTDLGVDGANLTLGAGIATGGGNTGKIILDAPTVEGETTPDATAMLFKGRDSTNLGEFGGDLTVYAGSGDSGSGNLFLGGYNIVAAAENNNIITALGVLDLSAALTVSVESTGAEVDISGTVIGLKAQSSTDPSPAEIGDIYYNTTFGRFRKYDGTNWTWWDSSDTVTNIVPIDYKDDTLTTLPTDTATTVDSATIVDGDYVLFTALLSGNNSIYLASVSGTSITWTLSLLGQDPSGAAADGDIVWVKSGTNNKDYIFVYDGATWVNPAYNSRGAVPNSVQTWDGDQWSENSTILIGSYSLSGASNGVSDASPASDLTVTASQKTAGTGDGGDLYLSGGSSFAGNQGKVYLDGYTVNIAAQYATPPLNGEAGDIFYHTDEQRLYYHDSIGYLDINNGSETKEPTGFTNRTDSDLSWDDGTRTFTITPSGASFEYFIKGKRYQKTSAESVVIPDDHGIHFISYNGDTLEVTSGAFDLSLLTDKAYVANVYWDATNDKAVVFGDERHGLTMDYSTHGYLHSNLGLRITSGLNAINFTTTGDGTDDAHCQIGITDGVITDEDINHSITDGLVATPYAQPLTGIAEVPVYYKLGVDTQWTKDTATSFPVKVSTNVPQYNFYNTGTSEWEVQPVPDTEFYVMWVFATNDSQEPIVAVMGQDTYADQTTAESDATYASMVFGDLPAQEMKALYRLIFEYDSTYTNTPRSALRVINDVRTGVDFHLGSYTVLGDHGTLSGLQDQDHGASAIFTSTGSFGGILLTTSETDVQLALDRIDNVAAKNNLINVESFASDPGSPVGAQQVYYNTTLNQYKYYNGSVWLPLGSSSDANADRVLSLVQGGTKSWNPATNTLTWTAAAYIQVPGVFENRNTINAGSAVLTNDGDVAYVDIERSGVGAAILPVSVSAINALDMSSPTGNDRVIIARRSNGKVFWGVGDGQRDSVDSGVLIEKTLTDNSSGNVFSVNAANNDTIIVKYSIKRGVAVEVGHLYITNDGTSAGITGQSGELADAGITFDAAINGANVELNYTATNTGSNANMKYSYEAWNA